MNLKLFMIILFVIPSLSLKYPDENDYYKYPRCGNLPMAQRNYFCYCGNVTLSGIDLSDKDTYCCVPEDKSCEYSRVNTKDSRKSDVICKYGKITEKAQSCNNQCWNTYRNSSKLYRNSRLYCKEEELCIRVPKMCSGICEVEEKMCSNDLRCSGEGYRTVHISTMMVFMTV